MSINFTHYLHNISRDINYTLNIYSKKKSEHKSITVSIIHDKAA